MAEGPEVDPFDPDKRNGSEYFENIPPEILNSICSHLTLPQVIQLRRVSKSLYKLANTYIANKYELDLTSHPMGDYNQRMRRSFHIDNILARHIFTPPNRWSSLRVLRMRGSESNLTTEALNIISRNISTLEDCFLSIYHITNTAFREFVKSNRNLVRLKLQITYGRLTLGSLNCLFRNLEKLKYLMFQWHCFDFYFNGIDFSTNLAEKVDRLFKKKPNLFFLSLKTHKEITDILDPILQHLFSSTLVVAVFHHMPTIPMPKLKQIIVDEIPPNPPQNFWDNYPSLYSLIFDASYCQKPEIDKDIFKLPNCPITDLSLRHCRLTDLSTLRNLRSLDLRDSCTSSEEMVAETILNNPNITRLSIAGICFTTPRLMRLIGKTLTKIHFLDLTENRNVETDAIMAFAEAHFRYGVKSETPVIILAASMFQVLCQTNFMLM